MKKTTLLLAVLLTLFLNSNELNSQNTKPVVFQDFTVDMPYNIQDFSWNDVMNDDDERTGIYFIVQFEQTPNQSIQDAFRNRDIALKNYISDSSYFLFIPETVDAEFLKNSGIVSLLPVPREFKMSAKIRNGEIGNWAQQGDNVLVNLVYHRSIGLTQLVSEINSVPGVMILQQLKGGNMVTLAVPSSQLNAVASLPAARWIELIQEPDVKDDTRGRALHRSSNLDTQTATGRNYTGEGIGVMVRDDGVVGPHIDFQGRINNSDASGTNTANDHGDGVAGIMAGAGNLNPRQRGMAAGADVYVVNYVASFLDTPTLSLINSGDVQITNSSYSNGCNSGYTNSANTVDAQSNSIRSLLHVFSAGNSNGSDCGYGAGNQWGNITGGHKQGKNVIATANTFFNGALASSSSRGPAYDGRIKPDIAAHGQGQGSTDDGNTYMSFGGTSAAAPGIAGIAAQLYELYKAENSDELPDAALIKATLLNTANDYGNQGPDFKFGWGMVNALRAGMLIEDERYLKDEISEGEANAHTISVPANTSQVRFMLYWSDPEAISGASTALVNDLDLTVTTPSSSTELPWVLNSTPNPIFLDGRASRGIDRLNNVEQVVINNPDAGDYTIDVTAFNIPVGPQDYYIVYEVITEKLQVTFPNGGEKLVPGEVLPIHWDAVNAFGTFSLEYSVDNGATWTLIGSASSAATNLNWAVPNNISGECLVRITNGSSVDVSDNTFSIASQVSGITVTQVCPDAITVTWDALTDATEYDVYLLGDRFMEVVGTTSDTTFSIPITNPEEDHWIALAARGGTTNWESLRTNAINQTGGLIDCPLTTDLTVTLVEGEFANLIALCNNNNSQVRATIRNQGANPETGFTVSYQIDGGALVEETYTETIMPGADAVYTFTTPLSVQDGLQTLNVWVTIGGDEYVVNDNFERAFFAQLDGIELNVIEDFESTDFLPLGWTLDNPDGLRGWVPARVQGPQGGLSEGVGVDNFNYTGSGQEDSFTTLAYDLNGTGLALNFDLAKAQFSSTLQDGLRVEISTDCGATFTTIYEKFDLELSTLGSYVTGTSLWLPTGPSDWRTETIDLSGYEGENVQFRFVCINGNGNTTLIDNVRVEGVLSTNTVNFDDNFSLYPNPARDSFRIRSNTVNLKELEIFSVLGAKVKTITIDANQQEIEVDIKELSSGIYMIKLESELGTSVKKIIKSDP